MARKKIAGSTSARTAPRYSGDLSVDFWRRINALADPDKSMLYAAGVILQDVEHRVLVWLDNTQESPK